MVTERLPFSYFHGNKCYGNKFLHQNHPAYQSKLSLKSGINQIKTTQKKIILDIVSCAQGHRP